VKKSRCGELAYRVHTANLSLGQNEIVERPRR